MLAQTSSEGLNPLYNLCLAEATKFDDLELTVNVRAVSGKLDQGVGVLWRAQDERNYYIAPWNPLEDNFRVYKVVDGKRQQLASADVKTEPMDWHEIRIVQQGKRIECFLDGEHLLEATDGAFPEPGMIGFWSKAAAVTHFDDLAAVPLQQE